MVVKVNNIALDVGNIKCVSDLIEHLYSISFDTDTLDDVYMFILNQEYIDQKDFDSTTITDGDTIDLFPLATGG